MPIAGFDLYVEMASFPLLTGPRRQPSTEEASPASSSEPQLVNKMRDCRRNPRAPNARDAADIVQTRPTSRSGPHRGGLCGRSSPGKEVHWGSSPSSFGVAQQTQPSR